MTQTNRYDGPVTACLVTHGREGELGPIIETLEAVDQIAEILVWHNGIGLQYLDRQTGELELEIAEPEDFGVLGRWQASHYAMHPLIYVQDDDCVVDVAAVLEHADAGRLVANMPRSRWGDYPDSTLVGWGAVVDKIAAQRAIADYQTELGEKFDRGRTLRCCDVVVSALLPRTVIDVGFSHLPWAELDTRMHKQPGHKDERDLVLEQARAVRKALKRADDDRRG